jgi:hypothetical protein
VLLRVELLPKQLNERPALNAYHPHYPMAQYEYKVLPFIGSLKSNQGANIVSEQLTRMINQHATEGWEFYEMGNVNIQVNPGCLASLFGASASYIRFDQLIFRRNVA